jgi:hypothetical protein
MGIIRGRGAIPQKWLEPIGESIQNVCLNTFLRVPKTLRELTGQTIDEAIKINNVKEYPLNIESGDSSIEKSWIENLKNKEAAREIHNIPPYELSFDLPHIKIAVDYLDGPNIKEGVEKKIKIKVDYKNHMFGHYVSMKWRLPEEWDATLGVKRGFYLSGGYATAENIMTITPGPLEGGFIYIEVEIRDRERENPYIIVVPFQCDNTIRYSAKAK